mmetsp:Transcript_12174/g.30278  ORF Transcript_12174/g.30278 Transcript_12174/m.30278 type:complete len:830 (+) Transcript_12174:28-2517(+)
MLLAVALALGFSLHPAAPPARARSVRSLGAVRAAPSWVRSAVAPNATEDSLDPLAGLDDSPPAAAEEPLTPPRRRGLLPTLRARIFAPPDSAEHSAKLQLALALAQLCLLILLPLALMHALVPANAVAFRSALTLFSGILGQLVTCAALLGSTMLAFRILLYRLLHTMHRVSEMIKKRLSNNTLERTEYEDSLWSTPQRPMELGLGALLLYTLLPTVSGGAARMLSDKLVEPLMRVLVEVCVAWIVLNVIEKLEARKVETTTDQPLAAGGRSSGGFGGPVGQRASVELARTNALTKAASLVVWLVLILSTLSTLGVDVRTVLAFSGVSSVALGLAFKDVIANFVSGLTVYLTQPFTVGDWIHTEDRSLDGWIEHIGWYYTKLNTWEKRPMYIPNSKFSSMVIINASRMSNRRILQTLRLRLQDLRALPDIVREIRLVLLANEEIDARQHRLVFFREVGQYSVDVWVSCFTRSVFLADWLSTQQDLLFQIGKILEKHGAKFASTLTREQFLFPQPAAEAVAQNPLPATAPPPQADSLAQSYGMLPDPAAAPPAPMDPPAGFKDAAELANAAEKAVAADAAMKELEALQLSLRAREAAMNEREQAIARQAEAVSSQEQALKDHEKAIRATERSIEELKKSVKAREEALEAANRTEKDKTVAARAEAVRTEEEVIRLKKAAVQRQMQFVQQKEEALVKDKEAFEMKEEALKQQEIAIAAERDMIQMSREAVESAKQAVAAASGIVGSTSSSSSDSAGAQDAGDGATPNLESASGATSSWAQGDEGGSEEATAGDDDETTDKSEGDDEFVDEALEGDEDTVYIEQYERTQMGD